MAVARLDYGIERQRHEGFVGRVAMLAELDRLLIEDETDRWVVVTGGPGMGKSAILAAWLSRREAADAVVPHHFIRRDAARGRLGRVPAAPRLDPGILHRASWSGRGLQ